MDTKQTTEITKEELFRNVDAFAAGVEVYNNALGDDSFKDTSIGFIMAIYKISKERATKILEDTEEVFTKEELIAFSALYLLSAASSVKEVEELLEESVKQPKEREKTND